MISIKVDEKNKNAVITMISSIIELDDCTEVFLKTKSDKEEDVSGIFSKDRCTISGFLQDIGIPCHLLGYKYLQDAISIISADPYKLKNIVKILYPEIAEKNHTTANRVERAIRHSVKRSFDYGNREKLEKMFGKFIVCYKGNVTNKEFITKLYEEIGAEYEDKN